jgi:hypothetical protein
MWKTHVFQKALGPMLQQINAEYEAPENEVLPSVWYFFVILLNPSLILFIFSVAGGWSGAPER